MKVTVEEHVEGGWIVKLSEGSFNTMRYIFPSEKRFIVINPFKIEHHEAEVDTFDAALRVAVDSGKNDQVKPV